MERGRPKTEIEFALAGAGNLAKWEHLPNIRKLPGVNLRAVYSAGGVRGKSYALRFGARRLFKNSGFTVIAALSLAL